MVTANEVRFVKVAVNVVRQSEEGDNDLPGILRGWFGPDAGAPGTRHTVALEKRGAEWHLRPLGQRAGEPSAVARIFAGRDPAPVRARVLDRNLERRV